MEDVALTHVHIIRIQPDSCSDTHVANINSCTVYIQRENGIESTYIFYTIYLFKRNGAQLCPIVYKIANAVCMASCVCNWLSKPAWGGAGGGFFLGGMLVVANSNAAGVDAGLMWVVLDADVARVHQRACDVRNILV